MKRLTAYLAKAFATETLALFGATLVLLWLLQCLRIFDIISVKGQNLWVLGGQAALAMPPVALVFLYVCMGIGMGRALRALQQSRELHIIHTSRRVPALLAATAVFIGVGMVAVVLLANFIEPYASRQLKTWTASVAADMVGRTLVPHRFTQVTPGLVMVIGGREAGGRVIDFFADDRRDPSQRRTYVASSATVAEDDAGYIMQLYDGSLQYTNSDGQYSEVDFGRYDIALDRFSSDSNTGGSAVDADTLTLILKGYATGSLSGGEMHAVVSRLGESLRVPAMCLMILAIAGLPSGSRSRFSVPIELVALLIAFIERAISSYATGLLAPTTGAAVILVLALLILAIRFRHRRIPPVAGVPA